MGKDSDSHDDQFNREAAGAAKACGICCLMCIIIPIVILIIIIIIWVVMANKAVDTITTGLNDGTWSANYDSSNYAALFETTT